MTKSTKGSQNMNISTSNCLIAVGCDEYHNFLNLKGAENDASEFVKIFCKYDQRFFGTNTFKILSPTAQELNHELKNIIKKYSRTINVINFFFAGHSVFKDGKLFLCLKDTNPKELLSLTSLSFSQLADVLAETKANEINIILDSCSSGGASCEIDRFLKSPEWGEKAAGKVTVLSACEKTKYAYEEKGHGKLTQNLLNVISGEIVVNKTHRWLSLFDIATTDKFRNILEQTPIINSLNFSGMGSFCTNRHFDELEAVDFSDSKIPQELYKSFLFSSKKLLKEYSHKQAKELASQIKESFHNNILCFLQWAKILAENLRENKDIILPSEFLGCCLTELLTEDEKHNEIQELLDIKNVVDTDILKSIVTALDKEPKALICSNVPQIEYYILPMRIARILGLASLLTYKCTSDDKIRLLYFKLLEQIRLYYPNALQVLSEDQAADIYVFLNIANQVGYPYVTFFWRAFFESYLATKGKILSHAPSGEEIFKYLLNRAKNDIPASREIAKPSEFLPIFAVTAQKLNLQHNINLFHFDYSSQNIFICENWDLFGKPSPLAGKNYSNTIGLNHFTIKEFLSWCNQKLKNVPPVKNDLQKMLILESAAFFKERIPWIWE